MRYNAPDSQLACFVVTAPGLERITAQEMRSIGLLPRRDISSPRRGRDRAPMEDTWNGGVPFDGRCEHLYRANLWLRTATRVLVRLGDFDTRDFADLRKQAGQLSWERYLIPGQPVTMYVTSHGSRLYHTGAIAERVTAAIGDRLGRSSPLHQPGTDDVDRKEVQAGQGTRRNTADRRAPAEPLAEAPVQRIVVRFAVDHCTISVDSSGALLHRRGYRLETTRAPMRETLAAAMLLAANWDPSAPLLDPFCGSGTIAIEAALFARGQPPGALRNFSFERWPTFEPDLWADVRGGAGVKPPLRVERMQIQASDRDAGAVRIAQANAARAGMLEAIDFSQRALSAVEPPPGPGWVITNPPYGLRVGGEKDLRNLYAQLGNVLRLRCPGWRVALLSSDDRLLGQIGLDMDTALRTVNGGISVRVALGLAPIPTN
jgi:putative N6-adenine-specific DNA methylase